MKLNKFGTDIELRHYTNLKVKDLVAEVSELSGLPIDRLKLKVVEETQSFRIDNNLYTKESLTLPEELRELNSLHDLKIANNEVLLVEELSEGELQGGSGDASKNVELLDDTESMRTVLANIAGYEESSRYQINIDWTLEELTNFLKEKFELGEDERRLRNLTTDKLFHKEELG